jgi:hypothetical protein
MNGKRPGVILIAAIGVLAVLAAALALALRDGGQTSGRGGFADSNATTEDAVAGEPQSYGEYNSLARGGASVAEVPAAGAAPEASVATDGATSAGPALPGLLDRKIVQSATLDLEVKEVGRQFQEIIRIAETAGGFVASSSFSSIDEQQVADLTIRVPAANYQDALARVRALGEVGQEGSDASDVTEEYTDLQSRLRALEATERRYLELLGRAETINDILQLQDRLDAVRGQIEQVQGRINLLDHVTELATITVHVRPLAAGAEPPAPDGGPHPINAAENAWESSLEALRGLAAAALVVAVFSWWLLPPAVAFGLGARWWLSRRPRLATEVPG